MIPSDKIKIKFARDKLISISVTTGKFAALLSAFDAAAAAVAAKRFLQVNLLCSTVKSNLK